MSHGHARRETTGKRQPSAPGLYPFTRYGGGGENSARVRPFAFDLSRLRADLRPLRLHWFPRLGSTNDHAAAMRRRGDLFAPAVVLAGRQTAGRGRGGHSWWSGKGCLTVTFVFPADAQPHAHRVPLIAGLAVRGAAAAAGAPGCDALRLKWPNDLVCEDGAALGKDGAALGKDGAALGKDGALLRKVGGLLCERVHGADLIGLGLNVNLDPASAPAPLRGRVASLSQLAGRPLDLTTVLAVVARRLYGALSEDSQAPFPAVLREYDSHHALVGRTVGIVNAGAAPLAGRCEGLDEMGRLLLRAGSTLHRVIAGQVVPAPGP